MATFKNIRIKKPGGGTRMQRVKVLASGKYRFVKNKTKSRVSKKRKKTSKKRSVKRTARKRKSRGKRKFTLPLAVVGGLAAGMAAPINAAMSGDILFAMDQLAYNYAGVAGVSSHQPHFDIAGLQRGLAPLIIGVLVHKFVGGSPLNVNRALAAAGIPFIRI